MTLELIMIKPRALLSAGKGSRASCFVNVDLMPLTLREEISCVDALSSFWMLESALLEMMREKRKAAHGTYAE